MSDTKTVRPEVMAEVEDTLKAVQLEKDEKPVEGAPEMGDYKIAVRKGMTFWGDRQHVVTLLGKVYPGCTFSWKV